MIFAALSNSAIKKKHFICTLKINLDGEKDKPDVKSNKEHKRDTKPNIQSNKEQKQDVKTMKTEPDTNKITYEEEKVALVLGITSIFTVWWLFK